MAKKNKGKNKNQSSQPIPSSATGYNYAAKITENLVSSDKIQEQLKQIINSEENNDEKQNIITYVLNNLDSFENVKEVITDKFSEEQKEELKKQRADIDAQQAEIDKQNLNLNIKQEEFKKQKANLDSQQADINKQKLDLSFEKESYKETIDQEKEQEYNQRYESKLRRFTDIINEKNDKIKRLEEENESLDTNALKNQIVALQNKNEQIRTDWLQAIEDKKSAEEKAETFSEKLTDLKISTTANINKTADVAIELQKNITAELNAKIREITQKTREYEDAVKELDNRLNDGDVFEGLANIKIESKLDTANETNVLNLHDFCEKFRAYAQKQQLYYTEETICTFIAGLNTSHLMILEGKSGTGKTSLPRIFADFLGDSDLTTVIPVQASWKDKHDLLGFYNEFSQKFRESEFLKALYVGLKDKENIHIILLDEMNLSRIEYYFADFLSAMELDTNKQEIKLLPGNKTSKILDNKNSIKIAPNIWFVGTANKDDSTFLITDKVYDRASVLRLDEFGEKDNNLRNIDKPYHISYETLNKFFNGLENKNVQIPENIKNSLKFFDIVITNRTTNQIKKFVNAYCACKGNDEAITEALDIILTNKVLRKLEIMYFDNSDKDKMKLTDLQDNLKHCEYSKSAEYIGKIISKLGEN